MKFSYLQDSEDLLLELKGFASASVPDPEVIETVSEIVKAVRDGGDGALCRDDRRTYLARELRATQGPRPSRLRCASGDSGTIAARSPCRIGPSSATRTRGSVR